jgi:rfaE bifunctional protein nucleotidyltransferase chain/domain
MTPAHGNSTDEENTSSSSEKDGTLLRTLLEDASNFEQRYIPHLAEVERVVQLLRDQGRSIVLMSGVFDLLHVGHAMYLEDVRHLADFLVVGVDSDARVKVRKGSDRPVVPELERVRLLTHMRGVGIVTMKGVSEDPRWSLVKAVKPDVLVVEYEAYDDSAIKELHTICADVVVMNRPVANLSTSTRLQKIRLGDQSTTGDKVLPV